MNGPTLGMPSFAVAKPLIRDALGVPFLAYILNSSDHEVEKWLESTSDKFGTPHQDLALGQLLIILHHTSSTNDNPYIRRLDISRLLSLYQEPAGTTIVNAIRMISTQQNTHSSHSESATLEQMLELLARDSYPLYLLPEGPERYPNLVTSLYGHPVNSLFQAAVMADDQLGKIFDQSSKHTGRTGSIMRSTGRGGGIQLSTFADTLVGSGWRMAQMQVPNTPPVDDHVDQTLSQLQTLRKALSGDTVRVPVRVGFTGVLLHSEKPLDFTWGTLRKVDARDRHLIPPGIDGKVSGTRADGSEVTVDYSGDIVLETSVEYKVKLKEFDLSKEWPNELSGHKIIQRHIESFQLGALLSEEYNTTEPIAVLPTWRHVHDPLSHGYEWSWSDPRTSRSFMPKQLTAAEEEEWVRFSVAIENNRTKYTDVAVRRTLRAASERRDYSDALVDTVIAWENLVGSQTGEPTLRVSGSLAWLIERNISERLTIRSEISKIYHLRSQIVHGSITLPPEQEIVAKSIRAMELTISALRVLFTSRQDLLSDCKGGDERSLRLLMGG